MDARRAQKIASLRRLQLVRNAVQFGVLRRVRADGAARSPGVGIRAFEARAVALMSKTGKIHLELVAGSAAMEAH